MESVETGLHRTKHDAVVLELTFHGGHWQFDREIRDAINSTAKAWAPAGILLNLSKFRYRGGDYASGFLEAFFDPVHHFVRPACIVHAPDGVRRLLELVDIGGTFGVRFFDSRAEALEYLGSRL